MIEQAPTSERAVQTIPQQDPEEPKPYDDARLLKLATDAYRTANTYFDANIRLEIENDLRQWQSMHARNSKYNSTTYAGRSRLFRPKTRSFVQKAESKAAEAFFSTVDVVNIKPDDPDDKLANKAALFYKALLQKRLTMPHPNGIPWYLTCIGAYQETMVPGVCISLQTWDNENGANRPKIDLVPIENFRFDPAADWRDPVHTSPYLVHMIPMYIGDVKARIASGKWRPLTDGQLQSGAKSYADSIRLQRENNRIDHTNQKHEYTDFDTCWVHSNIVRIDGVDMQWYTIGTEFMLSDPVPVKQKYPHGRPYVIGFSTIEAHRNYPSSSTRLARDIQREANDLANSRIDNVNFVLNKRYFAKRNKQVDLASLVRNMPGSVTLLEDPEKDVRVVETPDVTSSAYQEQDRLNLDFDDVVGGMAQSSVASNRKLNETVGGMNMLQTAQNQVDAYRLRTFIETWVEPVLQQLIEIEKNYEDDVRIVTMAVQAAGLKPEELGDHLWDMDVQLHVNVGMQATNPQDKANMLLFAFNSIRNLLADGALEQRGANTEEIVKEIFAMVGYRDGSRFFNWQDADPNVIRLEQQVQELQKQLDMKMPRELLMATVEKMAADTILKNVQAFYSAMQAGQVVASVPSIAPIADTMLQASGFQPNPEGVDPNIPAPAAPDPALTQGDVYDPRTGVGFLPGARANTNPSLPAPPKQADAGAAAGIETPRADGAQ